MNPHPQRPSRLLSLLLAAATLLASCGGGTPGPRDAHAILDRFAVVGELPDAAAYGPGAFHAPGTFDPRGRVAVRGGEALVVAPGETLVAEVFAPSGSGVRVRAAGGAASQLALRAVCRDGGGAQASGRLSVDSEGGELELELGSKAERYLLELSVPDGAADVRVESAELLASRQGTNVVIIVVDTLRADHVFDAEGRTDLPGLARLASDGVVFPNAFAHAPMTLPSHTSLFSGQLVQSHGVIVNGQEIPPGIPLLSQTLQESGYSTTGVISMAVLKGGTRNVNVDRGFETYRYGFRPLQRADETYEVLRGEVEALALREPAYLFLHLWDPHEPYTSHGTISRDVQLSLNGEHVRDLSVAEMGFHNLWLELQPGENRLRLEAAETFSVRSLHVREAGVSLPSEWVVGERNKRLQEIEVVVENERDVPVRANFDMFGVAGWTTEQIQTNYRREVEYVDEYLGRVFELLDEHDLYDDSLIVFTSDHGEALGEHGSIGHVQNVYDEMIHVPLVVKLPAGHERSEDLAARANAVVAHIDVVPTICEVLDIPVLPGNQGDSLFSLEVGSSSGRPVISQTHPPQAKRLVYGLRDDRYKMVYVESEEAFEMYDLWSDPGELENVFEAQNGERPKWRRTLQSLAESGPREGSTAGFSAEAQEELNNLGYN